MSLVALRALLAPVVAPQPLIFADQNGPRPSLPFCTLAVSGTDMAGGTVESEPDAAGIMVISEQRRMNVELQCFGPGGFDLAQAAGLRLRFPSHVARAAALNVTVSLVRRALRVPELLNESQFEERGILEFTAYAMGDGTDNVGLIQQVNSQLTTNGDILAPNRTSVCSVTSPTVP